jgi:hypothetical protein
VHSDVVVYYQLGFILLWKLLKAPRIAVNMTDCLTTVPTSNYRLVENNIQYSGVKPTGRGNPFDHFIINTVGVG